MRVLSGWEVLLIAFLVIASAFLMYDYVYGTDALADSLGYDGDGSDDGGNYAYLSGGDSSDSGDGSGGSGSNPNSAILNAIASFENVASQHNNPGAICGGYTSTGQCTGPATYGSLAEGTAKALALVSKYLVVNPTITVAQFVQKWSGASGAVLANYTNHVASELGLDPSDPISDAGGDDE